MFGAGGHGKGIIDAMSAFRVKGILRRDIAGLELWWKDRHDICEYLKGKEDDMMLYCHVPSITSAESRKGVNELPLAGCMKNHMFVYTPNHKKPLMKQFLCDCSKCLELEFEQCEKENVDKVKDDIIDERIEEADCELDAYNNTDIIYDFIEVPTFVTMSSSDRNHVLFYVIKVIEKNIASENM